MNISKFLFFSFAAVLMSGCSLGPVDDDAAPRDTAEVAPRDTAEVAPRDTAEVAPRDTEDVARCLIKQSGVTTYSGDCAFHLERGGSFSIRRSDDEPIQPGVTDINVSIVSPGVAEVRGLTTDGINSRWGAATRSTADGACWTGSDFEICAYSPRSVTESCPAASVMSEMPPAPDDTEWFDKAAESTLNYAKQLEGFSEAAAESCVAEAGLVWRVVRRDGEWFAATDDYSPQRVNAMIENSVVTEISIG